VITKAKSGSALLRVGAKKGIRPMKINKTAIQSDVVLKAGNRSTLPQCGKEVRSFADWILVTLNVNDDVDDKNVSCTGT